MQDGALSIWRHVIAELDQLAKISQAQPNNLFSLYNNAPSSLSLMFESMAAGSSNPYVRCPVRVENYTRDQSIAFWNVARVTETFNAVHISDPNCFQFTRQALVHDIGMVINSLKFGDDKLLDLDQISFSYSAEWIKYYTTLDAKMSEMYIEQYTFQTVDKRYTVDFDLNDNPQDLKNCCVTVCNLE